VTGPELDTTPLLGALSGVPIQGTLINVAAVLAGTALGVGVGGRLPPGLQQRVLAGLGLVTAVIGVDLALAWRDTSALYVLGAILLGAVVGEALDIEGRLGRLGDRLQARVQRDVVAGGERSRSTVSEAFFTASLLFCVGPLTVIGSFEDGLRGNLEPLATKSLLDGFASIALASTLGVGVAFAAITVLLVQGALTLGAGLFDGVLRGEALSAMTSTGGVLIIGISLKLLDLKDVKVGNFLPALVLAPLLVGIVGLVS
jgi:uncharacterized membrane protein YqgA involved in biofilm formation